MRVRPLSHTVHQLDTSLFFVSSMEYTAGTAVLPVNRMSVEYNSETGCSISPTTCERR